MGREKEKKISLSGYGNYLKMDNGCFVLRDSKGNKTSYPALEKTLGEITLEEGNVVTTGALVYCGLWAIDVVVTTKFGEPIAMLKNFIDDSYVNTRISQYESLKNGKGIEIAKRLLIGKLNGCNLILEKYGLEPPDFIPLVDKLGENNLSMLRNKLLSLEGRYAQHYFREIYKLFPQDIRPLSRVSYNAHVGLNNVFNLAYTFLKWKCYRAVVRAHLEPYLGYLHTYIMPIRQNLVCDFMELYRYLIDDFLITNCRGLTRKDYYPKKVIIGDVKAKRMYLKDDIASELVNKLNKYFTKKVKIPRMKRGEVQELETLINEEALLLAKYLRGERESWSPRLAIPIDRRVCEYEKNSSQQNTPTVHSDI